MPCSVWQKNITLRSQVDEMDIPTDHNKVSNIYKLMAKRKIFPLTSFVAFHFPKKPKTANSQNVNNSMFVLQHGNCHA